MGVETRVGEPENNILRIDFNLRDDHLTGMQTSNTNKSGKGWAGVLSLCVLTFVSALWAVATVWGVAGLSGCAPQQPEKTVDPYPAPDVALIDANKGSPTFGTQRTLSGTGDAVVIIYFASYT